MEWIKVINDAIEFMEKNLTEEIGLLEVARSVNISAYHFHHAFTIMTGITPAEYIRNRRLTLAGGRTCGWQQQNNRPCIEIWIRNARELYQGFFTLPRIFSHAGA